MMFVNLCSAQGSNLGTICPILQQLVKGLYCGLVTVVSRCCCMIDLAVGLPQMVAGFGLVDADGLFLDTHV